MTRGAAKDATYGLRKFAKITGAKPSTVVLGGLGMGMEIPTVEALWPEAGIVGVDPLREYVTKARMDYYGRKRTWEEAFLAGENRDERPVYCNYRVDQRASMYPLKAEMPGETIRTAEAITLDELNRRTYFEWGNDVLLCLDTEGAEQEIVAGASRELLERVTWINTEISFMTARRGAATFHELNETMLARGYRIYAIHSLTHNGRQADAIFLREDEWLFQSDMVAKLNAIRKLWRKENGKGGRRELRRLIGRERSRLLKTRGSFGS